MIKRCLASAVGLIERSRIGSHEFVIVSNNCWGASAYKVVNRPYNTPFVGLFLYPDCYVRLLTDFACIPDMRLSFRTRSKYLNEKPNYPIGVLGNELEIHFLHYSSATEAQEKWSRRADRLGQALAQDTPVFMRFCDREGGELSHIERFHDLPYQNKVSLGVIQYDNPDHLYVPAMRSKDEDSVVDGQTLFRRRYACFDFAHWIRTGKIEKNWVSRTLGLIS